MIMKSARMLLLEMHSDMVEVPLTAILSGLFLHYLNKNQESSRCVMEQ